MSLILTDIQEVELSIKPVTAAGNPATVDGAPVWGVSNPDVGTMVVAADGMSAKFVTSGKLGTAQINVTADADMGSGTTPINGTLDIEVVASQAVGFSIVTGTPTDKVP